MLFHLKEVFCGRHNCIPYFIFREKVTLPKVVRLDHQDVANRDFNIVQVM